MSTIEDEEFVDYVDDGESAVTKNESKEEKTGSYVGVNSLTFNDLLLKPELLRAIAECAFEHPSEVQHECIPKALYGSDIICQAKSGMGKTAVFVLSVLNQIAPTEGVVDTIVLCHARELAYQITKEFQRLGKYLPDVKVACIYGGSPVVLQKKQLEEEKPNIIVGCPGRILALIKKDILKVDKVKRFILDECDKLLESTMREDVQEIFKPTPLNKQVMLFSATISQKMKKVCALFTNNPIEVYISDDKKLTLHGLQQYVCKLKKEDKIQKLNLILDNLSFSQVVVFVGSVRRAKELNKVLRFSGFPSMAIHSDLPQVKRIQCYKDFKDFKSRILVSTDLFARGVDFRHVNIVVNYDVPQDDNEYLHRVGRSGRFGTKGLAVTFSATEEDEEILKKVRDRFKVNIKDLPDNIKDIDQSSYK